MYESGQASVLFKYWSKDISHFILGGPADADEAQTVKARFPNVRCVSFEPNPESFEVQKQRQVDELYPVALWNNNQSLTLSVMGNSGRSSRVCGPPTVEGTGDSPSGVVTVKARTLDYLSKRLGPWGKSALWLDIEYAEMPALEGGKEFLKTVELLNLEIVESTKNLPRFQKFLSQFDLSLVETWNLNKVPDRVDAIFKRI